MKREDIEIIIIEDEEDILELLEYNLQKVGYLTTGFLSTDGVEQFLEEESPSLMLIDRNLPNIDGAKFIKYIRESGYNIPVIFLTAKSSDRDLEEGFIAGGDDYMTKPFKIKELILRVEALLRRSKSLNIEKIKYKDLLLNISNKELFINNEMVKLTNLDFNLLYTFIKNPNRVLEKDFLREEVWDKSSISFDENSTIKVAINRLRKKIDPNGDKNYFISIRGVGYKMA